MAPAPKPKDLSKVIAKKPQEKEEKKNETK